MITRRQFSALLAARTLCAAAGGSKIRIGCQTRSYGNPPKNVATLLPLLEDMKAAGYEGFETNHVILSAIDDLAKARSEFDRRLPLIGLHLGVRWNNSETVRKGEADIARVARGVQALGGNHLMLSGTAARGLEGAALESAFQQKADMLQRVSEVCRSLNVRLCAHNHQEETVNNFAEMRFLAAHTKPGELSLLFDISHAALAGQDAASFVREHSSRIAGFHIRDRVGERQVPMGAGKVDLMGVAKAIRDTSWSGWLIVELEGEPIQGVSSSQLVRDARRFVREQMKF